MKVVIVSKNGKQICAAGADVQASIGVTFYWGKDNETYFAVGGLDVATEENLDWKVPKLKLGDEVTFRLVEGEEYDPPMRRETPQQMIERHDKTLKRIQRNSKVRQRAKKET